MLVTGRVNGSSQPDHSVGYSQVKSISKSQTMKIENSIRLERYIGLDVLKQPSSRRSGAHVIG